MESYDIFKKNNAAWDSEYGYCHNEKEMLENYEIAKAVEAKYNECYGSISGPRIGDVVEFCDGFHVYKHAIVTEDIYYQNKHGLLCVCERGSSWTDGKYFSTSGGAFRSIHKSLFQLVGEDENTVWTWGRNGAGAHQGIYLTLKVRKWLVPYKPIEARSMVMIEKNRKKDGDSAVTIQNFGNWFNAMHFDTIKAFLAWADYVGYKHVNFGKGTFERRSPQELVSVPVCHKEDVPVNGKPLKTVSNGRIVDAWAVTTDNAVTTYYDCFSPSRNYRYGTPQSDAEIKRFHKYSGNPLGI